MRYGMTVRLVSRRNRVVAYDMAPNATKGSSASWPPASRPPLARRRMFGHVGGIEPGLLRLLRQRGARAGDVVKAGLRGHDIGTP